MPARGRVEENIMECPICKTGNLDVEAGDITRHDAGELIIFTVLECSNPECKAQFSDTGEFSPITGWHSEDWPMVDYEATDDN